MSTAQDKILSLMSVFDRIDSTGRQIENEAEAFRWRPAEGMEKEAFDALIALENRPALKEWYASIPAINPHAELFRRVLERATSDCLPVGG